MNKILLLTGEEVRSLVSIPRAIESVESAFSAYARGEAVVPPVVNLQIPNHKGEIDVKSAYIAPLDLTGIKVASGYWENQERFRLPSVLATILLLNGSTGLPLCIMDGSCITSIRTSAAGAVAAKHLARTDVRSAAVLGAGTQGRAQLRGLVEVRSLRKVKIYDELEERAEVYCREMSAELPGLEIEVSSSVQQAVEGADIIVTATPSTNPLVLDEWVTRGVHINAMGADAPGKQELDARLFPRAKVVVDRLSQCSMIGECQHALSLGLISREDIYAEIGEVTAGRKPGRESAEEITIFDSTGVAIQDVAVATLVYEMASKNGLGIQIALHSV